MTSFPSTGSENVKDAVETPMDVCDESMLSSECVSSNNKTFSNTNVQNTGNLREAASESVTATTPHLMLHGCDNNSSSSSTIGGSSISPQTSRAVNDSDLGLENQPCPRHISEQELHVLQVNCQSRILQLHHFQKLLSIVKYIRDNHFLLECRIV